MVKKFIGLPVITLVCLAVALFPEIAMYVTYRALAPEDETAKLVLLSSFWLAGSGSAIAFAALGLMVWAALTSMLLEG